MKFIIIFLCLLVIYPSAMLSEKSISNNLYISQNITGPSFQGANGDKLVAIINNAYTFFRDDFQQQCDFIATQAALIDTSSSYIYTVVIITEDQTSSMMYASGDTHFVYWKGVNKLKIGWTYFINGMATFFYNSLDFIEKEGYGSGITIAKAKAIESILLTAEEEFQPETCLCLSASGRFIRDQIQQFEAARYSNWHVACKPKSNYHMHGYLPNYNHQYILISAGEANCEYMLFADDVGKTDNSQ